MNARKNNKDIFFCVCNIINIIFCLPFLYLTLKVKSGTPVLPQASNCLVYVVWSPLSVNVNVVKKSVYTKIEFCTIL